MHISLWSKQSFKLRVMNKLIKSLLFGGVVIGFQMTSSCCAETSKKYYKVNMLQSIGHKNLFL